MIDIILLSIIISLFIFGWNYAITYTPIYNYIPTDKKEDGQIIHKQIEVEPDKKTREIAWFFRFYIRKVLVLLFKDSADYFGKPIYGCVVCMASVYGTMFYWSYIINIGQIINSKTIILWVVVVVMVAGINRVLRSFL